MDTKLPREEVVAEALSILDEMAHNLRTGAVRGFAFFLIKVMKSLYRRIYVNVDGIQKVSLEKRSFNEMYILCLKIINFLLPRG